MGKPHRVLLSRQAVEILRQVHELTGRGDYVFPSVFRGSVPMGDVTWHHFFKRTDFGVPDFSPHGTRGTAATLLREHGFGRDVVELLLAHSEKNATVAAFSDMELAAERKRALQYLADRIEALAASINVIASRAAAVAVPAADRGLTGSSSSPCPVGPSLRPAWSGFLRRTSVCRPCRVEVR